MVFEFIKKILALFTKKKEVKKVEPMIPDHRKEQMQVAKRKDDIQELKKTHEKIKEEKDLVDILHESVADQKLVDIDFEEEVEVALFKISGVYNIGPTQMLTGFLEAGRLKKGMKSIVNETNIKVTEIRKNNEKVDYLLPGQEGTIVVQAKKNPLLRQDDYLEFE